MYRTAILPLLGAFALLGVSAPPALAQGTPDTAASAPATTPAYVPATGDAWLDVQLADINRYATRYPATFLDELERYFPVTRGYAASLRDDRGWAAGDVYFACALAKAIAVDCPSVVRARSNVEPGSPVRPWSEVAARLDAPPGSLAYRAVRQGLVGSFDRWGRPIELDALLQRQLPDRAAP